MHQISMNINGKQLTIGRIKHKIKYSLLKGCNFFPDELSIHEICEQPKSFGSIWNFCSTESRVRVEQEGRRASAVLPDEAAVDVQQQQQQQQQPEPRDQELVGEWPQSVKSRCPRR